MTHQPPQSSHDRDDSTIQNSTRKRAELTTIIVKCGLHSDSRILILREQFGEAAYGRWILLRASLSAVGGGMPLQLMYALWQNIGAVKEEFRAFIDFCLQEKYLLWEGDKVVMPEAVEDCERVQKQRDDWAEEKRLGRRKKKGESNVQSEAVENTPRFSPVSKQTLGGRLVESEKEPEPEKEEEPEKNPEGGPGETKPGASELEVFAQSLFDYESPIEIGTGRRRLEAYPNIWATLPELMSLFKSYETAGLPRDWWPIAFRKASSEANSKVAEQARKGQAYIPPRALSWLQNWCLSQTLREYQTSLDARRSEISLKKAEAR